MNNDLFNLTPEMQLLLACCRLSMKQNDQDRKESVERLSAKRSQESIDWEGFIKLVERHRVHTLAYRHIHQYAAQHIPANIRLALRDRSDQKRRQMLNLTAELVRLFAQHDFSRIWGSVSIMAWNTYPLPDVLFPLYYVLGPFFWLRRKFSS